MEGKSIKELLEHHTDNGAVRNNGGGYFNHDLFWSVMSPGGGGKPEGAFGAAINDAFGSYEEFKNQFA